MAKEENEEKQNEITADKMKKETNQNENAAKTEKPQNIKEEKDKQSPETKVETADKRDEFAKAGDTDKEKAVAYGVCKEEMSESDYVAFLETELGRNISEAQDCRNTAQRVQAEFENYRKRTETLGEEMRRLGILAVTEKMLDVLDNCDRARMYIKDENALMGFNIMEQQMVGGLTVFGLKELEIKSGDKFEAKTMHAIERVNAQGMSDKVVEVLAKGYQIDGKVIRHAKVKVGYEPQKDDSDGKAAENK